MKTPFTLEQFFEVFKNYNINVFPLQVLFYILAVTAVYISIKNIHKSGVFISIIFSFLWIWMGIVYHIMFFAVINEAAYIFGSIFILQGVLFIISGALKDNFSFRFHKDIYGISGLVLILYSLVLYPLLGYTLNHIYPYAPTFGLPCPTVIFTFGLLLWNQKKCPGIILVIPVIWSVIGFTAVINFGVIEDIGLLIAGIAATSLLLFRNKTISTEKIINKDKSHISL